MLGKKVIRIKKRLLTLLVLWFAFVQTFMPIVVLATELSETEPTADELSTPTPSDSPNPGSTDLETGDAYATSESLGITNSTLVDSEISVVQGDITDPTEDVILFDKELEATPTATDSTDSAQVKNDKEATESGTVWVDVENEVSATVSASAEAQTGDNTQQESGSAAMTTGDAYATAYATNIANTTLVDSTLEIALITLLTDWDGNLVLDPLTQKNVEGIASALGQLYLTNTGDVSTEAEAQAVTGENVQVTDGNATMVTGQALSVSMAATVANTTLVDAIIFDFFVQNFGLWSGQILNFAFPGSVQDPSDVMGRHILGTSEGCEGSCTVNLDIDNSAQVTTEAYAKADTGGNIQEAGEAEMVTGNAYASAMATTVVNSTLVNSHYRLLGLNLLAKWTGNLIFAYPDLALTITAPETVKEGEDIIYTVQVTNRGYGDDTGVILSVLDQEEVLGTMKSFETRTSTYAISTAGMGDQTMTLLGVVGGEVEEETLANNTASAQVVIERMSEESENVTSEGEEVSHEIPRIELASENNIASFIYPGDTTRYEAKVVNVGPGTLYDAEFENVFFNSTGEVVGVVRVNLGHLSEDVTRVIRFGLSTTPGLAPGEYYTMSVVRGRSDDRTDISSNDVKNMVPVRTRFVATVNAAQDVTNLVPEILSSEGAILGKQASNCRTCKWGEIVFLLTSALIGYYTHAGRKFGSRRLKTMAFGWGVSGYIFLILLNPECTSGILLVSGSYLCKYFLPLAIGESVLVRILMSQKTPLSGVLWNLARKMPRR